MEIEKAKRRLKTGIQLVTFRLGPEMYGIPVWKVKEIIRPLDTFSVPGMEGPVEGVINLRGEIIPVVRMNSVLGVEVRDEEADGKKKRIIILDTEGGGFGFVVDEVMEVIKVSTDDIRHAPDVVKNSTCGEAIIGIVRVSRQIIVCIDPRKLVADGFRAKKISECAL
jgi:chemotaxis signal transduction protein